MTTRTQNKPEAGDETASEEADGFIKFGAHNGVRTISKADWEAIGIKGQDAATWDRTNAWRLPVEQFSKAAQNYLLKVDGEFTQED